MAASSDKPTPADEEAMKEIANWARSGAAKKFPSNLQKYLETHDFKVLPPPSSATFPIHPYEVSFFQKIEIKALPSGTQIPAGEQLKFDAYVVRMIPRGTDGHAIKTFPEGDFVTVEVARPQSVRVVVTTQLSGCSFVIGHDKDKNLLHLGHAQPSTGGDVSHSEELFHHFKTAPLNSVFHGKELKKVEVIGGYGPTIAKVLGWISGGKLFIAVKTPEHVAVHEYS